MTLAEIRQRIEKGCGKINRYPRAPLGCSRLTECGKDDSMCLRCREQLKLLSEIEGEMNKGIDSAINEVRMTSGYCGIGEWIDEKDIALFTSSIDRLEVQLKQKLLGVDIK